MGGLGCYFPGLDTVVGRATLTLMFAKSLSRFFVDVDVDTEANKKSSLTCHLADERYVCDTLTTPTLTYLYIYTNVNHIQGVVIFFPAGRRARAKVLRRTTRSSDEADLNGVCWTKSLLLLARVATFFFFWY